MKKLLILHTGGTISMSQDNRGRVTPMSTNPLLKEIHKLSSSKKIVQEDIFNVPSPQITHEHMYGLRMRIERAIKQNFEAIVITHGTDTLEETAYFLDLTVGTKIPIVVTGAMRSSNELGADGLHNLKTAILVAIDPQTEGKGVLVVMNDEIHTAKYVTKTHTTNIATFQTPTFGPVGFISKNKVLYFQQLLSHEHYDLPSFYFHNVYLLKAYAGMDSSLFYAISYQKAHGVVIEALGAGNLPPATLDGIKHLLDNNIPVVLVSRAFNGVTQDIYNYVGGGRQLKDLGVIFTTGLSGQKDRIKLMVLLNTSLEKPLAEYFNHV